MSETPIFIVDAFVGELPWQILRGNPAAVALLDAPRDDAWMQEVAAEMNLSETAFVCQKDSQNFGLRWFTPRVEVDLCGHATLAAAHVLWESGRLARDQDARFHTRSGLLTAQSEGEWISLNFPAQKVESCALPDALRAALGLEAKYGPYPAFRAADDWLIEAAGQAQVTWMEPDFACLGRICQASKMRGVIASAEPHYEGFGYDFVSRFFAPAIGIDEDPVTGSAHAALAPFWCARLGKNELVGFQASPRGGLVRVELQNGRVQLGGRAQTAVRGELLL